MRYKPYAIACPTYSPVSGGVKVVYGLYGWMLAKGHIVLMNGVYSGDDFIAIYPEIYHGNPMGAKKVVRYLLNEPGVMALVGSDGSGMAGPKTFDPKDEIFVFSRIFMDVPEERYLFLPIINLYIFFDQKKQRTKKCVFFGKGQNTNLHPRECIELTREFANDQQKLADFLNECEVMYCYDPVSAMTEVARLCGCRVVIFPSKYSKEFYCKYEPGLLGISWGRDEKIPLDTEAFREHYEGLFKTFEKQFDRFIEITQQ